MNLSIDVPFDAQGLIDEVTASATIDEFEGYVQNIDQAAIEHVLSDYQQQIQAYIDSQHDNASVGDVLDTQQLIQQEHLPYKKKSRRLALESLCLYRIALL